jgi:transposase
MSNPRYSDEFKAEAVRQVLERGYSVKEVAERIGVCTDSLYKWVRLAKANDPASDELAKTKLENQRLKAELRRVQEERDILKKAAAFFAKDPK